MSFASTYDQAAVPVRLRRCRAAHLGHLLAERLHAGKETQVLGELQLRRHGQHHLAHAAGLPLQRHLGRHRRPRDGVRGQPHGQVRRRCGCTAHLQRGAPLRRPRGCLG